jgi:hypothetical protein
MADKMRPLSKENAPDPSDSYERSHPEHESGAGRLDNNSNATPRKAHDHMPKTAGNAQDGSRQINAHEQGPPPVGAGQPDHAMNDEEPLGWDTTPTDLDNPTVKREPRAGAKGRTHNPGEPPHNG